MRVIPQSDGDMIDTGAKPSVVDAIHISNPNIDDRTNALVGAIPHDAKDPECIN
jgi:hypothetical protein